MARGSITVPQYAGMGGPIHLKETAILGVHTMCVAVCGISGGWQEGWVVGSHVYSSFAIRAINRA